jgi:hypothetical protein
MGGSSGGTSGTSGDGTGGSSPAPSRTPSSQPSKTPAPDPTPTTQAPPSAPTIRIPPSPLIAGHAATITGSTDPGVTVELWVRSRPASSYRLTRTATAASDGSYLFTVTPSTTTDLYARAVRADQTATSRVATLPVRSAVSLAVSRTRTLTYRFSGSVLPHRGGIRISVYCRSGSGVALVSSTTTASNGSWSITRRFSKGATYTLYAVAAATSNNAAGTSSSYRASLR